MIQEKIILPKAYFKNIKDIISAISIFDYPVNAKKLADILKVSVESIYPMLKVTNMLKMTKWINKKYLLTGNGRTFLKYLEDNNSEKIKEYGNEYILQDDSNKTIVLRKAYEIIKQNPKKSNYDLGVLIADQFNKSWNTKDQYERVGGSCKNILESFGLFSTEHHIQTDIVYGDSINNLLGDLNRYCNQFLSLATYEKNVWKNHINLKQKIESNYIKLLETQNDIQTKYLIEEAKEWLNSGFANHNVNSIQHSIRLISKLDFNNLIK